MDDHRPTQTVEPDNEAERSSYAAGSAPTTQEPFTGPFPPFRSSRLILDDGRAVGLTEPDAALATRSTPGGPDQPIHGRWMPAMPAFVHSWSGFGVWLGAVTVVGFAAMMFSPSLSEPSGPETAGAETGREAAYGLDGGDGGGTEFNGQRGSRARTTGELIDDGVNGDPAARGSGRSSGPSDGLDLDLGHRSGRDVVDANGPTPASPATTVGAGLPSASTGESDASTQRPVAGGDDTGSDVVGSPTPTTRAISFPGSEPSTIAPPATVDVLTGDAGDGDTPGSVPPGSTSVPGPGTLPPQVTLPPSVTLPPVVPPTSGRPATPPQPPTSVEPPPTRPSVPADTRPSSGNGPDRGRGRGADSSVGPGHRNGSTDSNARTVGRQH